MLAGLLRADASTLDDMVLYEARRLPSAGWTTRPVQSARLHRALSRDTDSEGPDLEAADDADGRLLKQSCNACHEAYRN